VSGRRNTLSRKYLNKYSAAEGTEKREEVLKNFSRALKQIEKDKEDRD